jgi:UDP-N-acetylmuramoylalanine--D-glutamate ligase
MKVAVLGYGKQGKAAVDYWSAGNEITVCDQNAITDLHASIKSVSGPEYLANLNEYDLIVRSPSVHPRDIVAANSDKILRKVTTVTEEFFRTCPAPIIGVTGTKGKGTTSTLIAKIIETSGETVHLGGNIGIPPLDMLKDGIKPNDWVVLELANFQLIDLRISPKIAVCLMVVPAHLDWHTDLEEYVKAKQQLFIHQSSQDIAIFNRSNDLSAAVVDVSPALKLSYEVPEIGQTPEDRNGAYVLGEDIYMDDVKVCSVADVKLLGRHNLQNVCAAIAATWDLIDNDPAVIIKALSSYTGLPHRLELIRDFNGVKYYDDSFGTEPATAMVALQALSGNKVLILGGSDKGATYDELAEEVKNSQVHTVITIGQTGPAIAESLRKVGFTNIVDGGTTMQSIVDTARQHAKNGDTVLLSTACASFGMFKDYIDRGEQFKKTVLALV